MRISIFGTGYVGSVTGICIADLGHEIIFTDIDTAKLNLIDHGQIPVFEPGLQQILTKNKKKISTNTNPIEAIINTDISFICVGTPSREDGSLDTRSIESVSQTLGEGIGKKKNFHTIVVKSTVIPGTIEELILPIIMKESHKQVNNDFSVVSNPEFLREGNAVYDFFHPDRIIIGSNTPESYRPLSELYSSFSCPKMVTTIKTAEMIKYVNNAFLATKISFANEIGNICKEAGIDSYEVFKGVGMDSRINPRFFRSGIGFGGSCFPKDVRALIVYSKKVGIEPGILEAILDTNQDQPSRLVSLLKRHMDLKGKTIGILGLAFKPETDDIRESRAIPIIRQLIADGANVLAFDPVAMKNFQRIFPNIEYATTSNRVLETDAVLIITEWSEFENLDYTNKIVIDGRNIKKARKNARIYEGVCW